MTILVEHKTMLAIGECPRCGGSGLWQRGLECDRCLGSGRVVTGTKCTPDCSRCAQERVLDPFRDQLRISKELYDKFPDNHDTRMMALYGQNILQETLAKVGDKGVY